MPQEATAPAAVRERFLRAIEQLHERFLVDVADAAEVWLIRHADAYTGELVSFDEDHIDPPLSPSGREQADKLARRLRASGVTNVWHSPIKRARETAAIAAAFGGQPTHEDDRLREVRTAWDEGRTAESEIVPGGGYIPFVEPVEEVIARMTDAVRNIAQAAGPGGRVAAVTHAGAITMYLTALLQLDAGPLRLLPEFTSVTVLRLKDGVTVVQSIGDTGHLRRESAE